MLYILQIKKQLKYKNNRSPDLILEIFILNK